MLFKLWQATRGWKRNSGAAITVVAIVLQQLGIADADAAKIAEIVGAATWVIGAIDRVVAKIRNK